MKTNRERHTDGQTNLDEDKGKLEPEGRAQHAVLTEVNSKALVLGANENGRDDITGTIQQVSMARVDC